MNEHDDGARLRIFALEKRMAYAEQDSKAVKTWVLILAGLVVAAVLVGAFELRHILHFVKGAH